MTRKEMSEIFALMLLAWPKAPMLCLENLESTINLWTLCLPEVDFLTGQMATIQLCRTCHYPPSIAQMCEAAEKVRKELETEISDALLSIRNRYFYGDCNENRKTRAIALIGGEERQWIPINEREARFNIEEFREAYLRACQEEVNRTVAALYPAKSGARRLR